MCFSLNFEISKPLQTPKNDNIHDDAAWEASYKMALTFDPADKMPHQYAVHRIYEFLNRPWQSDHVNIREMTRWLDSMREQMDAEDGSVVWPVLCPTP